MSMSQHADEKQGIIAPSQAVVERIAALEDVGQTELDPLYGAIDPDALDTLVGAAGYRDSTLQVEFTYHGYNVTVTGEGVIHIDEEGAFER